MARSPHPVGSVDGTIVQPPSGQTKGEWLLSELRELATTMMPGEMFPSDRVLAGRYGVARMTVRGQLDTLVEQGLLRRRPGTGTFVQRPDAVISDSPLSLSFTTEMRARGLHPSSKILLFRRTSPTVSDRQILGVTSDEPIVQIVRVRYADGAPMSLARVRIPSARAPGLTRTMLDNRSLHELLATEYGIVPASAEQTIAIAWPRATDLEWLELPEESAALAVERVTHDAGGQVIEHARSIYHPDRYRVHMHVEAGRKR